MCSYDQAAFIPLFSLEEDEEEEEDDEVKIENGEEEPERPETNGEQLEEGEAGEDLAADENKSHGPEIMEVIHDMSVEEFEDGAKKESTGAEGESPGADHQTDESCVTQNEKENMIVTEEGSEEGLNVEPASESEPSPTETSDVAKTAETMDSATEDVAVGGTSTRNAPDGIASAEEKANTEDDMPVSDIGCDKVASEATPVADQPNSESVAENAGEMATSLDGTPECRSTESVSAEKTLEDSAEHLADISSEKAAGDPAEMISSEETADVSADQPVADPPAEQTVNGSAEQETVANGCAEQHAVTSTEQTATDCLIGEAKKIVETRSLEDS